MDLVGDEDMNKSVSEEHKNFLSGCEKAFSGTSWTNNEEFEKNGYFVVEKLINPETLHIPPPLDRGKYYFHGSVDKFDYTPVEDQVEGSLARYNYPPYKEIHYDVKKVVEKMIGRKLYPTYYYDRFYFRGQELKPHTDRGACEISVTYHVSTNLKKPWPFWIKTPDTYADKKKTSILVQGEEKSITLEAGDAIIYKGCERPHWRDLMPKEIFNRNQYYHQMFFHYVLQDGERAHYAFDQG